MFADFVVKKHPRAKRISFRVSDEGHLIVTLPKGLGTDHLKALLDKKGAKWFKQFTRPESKRPITLPKQLNLRAINRTIPITYNMTEGSCIEAYLYKDTVQVDGPISRLSNYAIVQRALHPVLRELGESYLTPALWQLAEKHDLAVNKVTVRGQKTRWGSCSEDKNISLNYKLLFLPEALCEHVLLHELCHTRIMDHSSRFWALLDSFDPNSKVHDQSLHHAQRYLPFFLRDQG